MNVEIVNKRLSLDVYGLSGAAVGRDYAGTAFGLTDRMWKIVTSNDLKHKGLNIWVYEPHDRVFAGVELEGSPTREVGLERKRIALDRYGYHKHVGPYQRIPATGRSMRDALEGRGLKIIPPYIEIYGHWTNDETKLEAELIMAVE